MVHYWRESSVNSAATRRPGADVHSAAATLAAYVMHVAKPLHIPLLA